MNTNTRTHNSIRNLAMSVFQKMIAIILTFVGRQIFLQVLTIEYLGISGLFSDIFQLLSLADLGLVTAMAYSFYKPLSEKNEDKLAALTGFYSKVYRVIAAFVALAGLLLMPFLRYIINLETDIPNIEIYYLITLANTVFSYLFVYKSTIITADQHGRIITKYSIWMNIIGLLVQIAVLLITGSFLLFCLVTVLTTITNNLIISRKAVKQYPFIKRKVRLPADDRREIFHNIKSIFIFKIANVVFKGTDSIFISTILGTAIVGMFANYRLAVSNLALIAFLVFGSLTPSIGNLVALESSEKRMRVFKVMQVASHWLGGFFVFCLFFLLDGFVTLWLGDEFVFGMFTKLAILVNFYLSITLYPIVVFREASGMYQKTKYAMVAAAALKIAFSIIMGIHFGLPGIVLATSASKLLTYAWYEPKILFRDFLGGSALKYFSGHLLNFLMIFSCIALVYFLIPQYDGIGWSAWLLKAIVCAVSINIIYLIRYCRSPELKVLYRILKMFRNNEDAYL